MLTSTRPQADGFETVNGRRWFRILGVERWRYPNGRVTGTRAITLWIDAETYLIHKVVQDTPRSMPRAAVNRRTTMIKHRASPTLEPAQFRFAVPRSSDSPPRGARAVAGSVAAVMTLPGHAAHRAVRG